MTKNFDSLNDTFNTSMEEDNTSIIKPQDLIPEAMKSPHHTSRERRRDEEANGQWRALQTRQGVLLAAVAQKWRI